LLRHSLECLAGKAELAAVPAEQRLVLLNEGVAGFGQDANKVVNLQWVERRQHWETAEELGDKSVVLKILRSGLYCPGDLRCREGSTKADGLKSVRNMISTHPLAESPLYNTLKANKRAAEDEQNVARVHNKRVSLGS
jgi:hypothetical protein